MVSEDGVIVAIRAVLGYLGYIARHKWFVFVECCRLGIPWRGIAHDLSKLSPAEFGAYMRYFTVPRVTGRDWPTNAEAEAWRAQVLRVSGYIDIGKPRWTRETVNAAFDLAWNHHQKRNPHHWQYWILVNDNSEPQEQLLEMPDRYRREMLADWRGAGRALGFPDTLAWYTENRDKIRLHPNTRAWIDAQLGYRRME